VGAVHSSPFLSFLSLDYHHFPLPSRVMLVMLIAFLIAAFALLCIRFPSVWSALMASDEPSDAHELGLVVASRASSVSSHKTYVYALFLLLGNPFRESGPPACMAKLIMMRHKVRKRPLHPLAPPVVHIPIHLRPHSLYFSS
jgi:hypothetical protein